MLTHNYLICRPYRRQMFFLVSLLWIMPFSLAISHPMPNSVVLLDIQSKGVVGEIQLPLTELELAFGHQVSQHTETLVARLGPQLRAYIKAHIRPISADGRAWTVDVGQLTVQPVEQSNIGPYQELTAQIYLQAPAGASPRQFTFNYDVIVHQLVTHKTLVSIRQDWETGRFGEAPADIGVIELDIPTNTIPPLIINEQAGGLWRGFVGMVKLGTHHIAEGTDHLLFLLVLLLPAPLLTNKKRWGQFGGVRYSLTRLLWVVTAFTLGHSITLLAGAIGWFRLPGQPIEVLIAFSILVSAIHAWRPLFPGRESWIAAGFGLIHGMAFANTLANLTLDGGRMALSILGFNIGIELMQLFIIALIVPWLILLSQTRVYYYVRLVGALFAAVAALAWMTERSLGQTNSLSVLVERIASFAPYLLGSLAILAIISFLLERRGAKISSQ